MNEPGHPVGPFSPRCSPARARIREALIELAVADGLDAVEVEALCRRAQVGRSEFEREFGGVRDCALRVYLANIADFDRVIEADVDPAEDWRTRLRTTAYSTARYMRDRPLSTHFNMIAMLAAGELAQAHRDRYVRQLIDLIDEGRRELADPDALGRSTAESLFGSIYQLVARTLVKEGGTSRAEEIVPELMYIAVRPYLGEEAAREELEMPQPPDSAPGR
jgi:AcrR family transcriptional regulator